MNWTNAVSNFDRRYLLCYLADGAKIQQILCQISGISTVPQVFVRGEFVGKKVHKFFLIFLNLGDSSAISNLKRDDKLAEVIKKNKYDYDLVVIGGGSGGLAASKVIISLSGFRFSFTCILHFVHFVSLDISWLIHEYFVRFCDSGSRQIWSQDSRI